MKKNAYLCGVKDGKVLNRIKRVVNTVRPAKALLFGSRARGDARADSDWDVLLLVDKDKIDNTTRHYYLDPFFDLSLETGEQINPIIYSLKDWERFKCFPFQQNVLNEGITL